ncbi:neuronal acetylcholine receptor subunit beta-3-like [Ostrea edulis]|uniref:neuronal acetylcholine receptor subunit beta-3-like n=1 Tax=Ostrea edulis TaxID=37623 RepID=UPI002094AA61|nr:neuronal acetylcholine receptor subunit beta-3-like [Ostrea edulis]
MVGNLSTALRVLPNSGYIKWTPKINPSTKCTYDAKFFPFDIQTCVVKLVPWGFQNTEIILTTSSSAIDLSHYDEQTHSQWSVMTTSISNKTISNQSFLEFSIVLHREPSFFIWYTIIPVCAVTLLMYFSFLMPNSKMTQGLRMTFLKARIKNVKKTRKDILSPPVIATRSRYIAVAFLFFAFIFKLNFYLIPHVSNPIPLICYFLIISLVAVGLAAIISVLVMRLDFKPKRQEVPERLKTIIAFILLRYWYPKEKERREERELQGRQPVQTAGEKRPLTAESTGEGEEEVKIDYMKPKEGITYHTVTTTLNSCFFMLFFAVSLTFTVLIILTVSVGKDS